MEEPNARENQMDLCRICNKMGVKTRHLFHDEQMKKEVLHKIHIIFPNVLIYENDPLPKGLCEGCELFVHATYERLLEFDISQQKLVSGECDTLEDQDYLRYYQEIQLLLDRISDLKRSISQKKKRELYHEPIMKHKIDSNLKDMLLKHESVKSLKRICIDFFNKHGPNLLDTYLKFELPPLTEEEELAELQQQQVFEKHKFRNSFSKKMPKRGGKGRFLKGRQYANIANSSAISKKKSNSFVKSTYVDPVLDRKNQESTEEHEELGRGARRKSRTLSRVNYAEDIPDSILFYDEIQSAKRRKLEEKVILESIKESKRSQTSPTPSGTIKLSNIPRTEEDVKQKLSRVFKSHPGTIVQINSSLSIKLKPSELEMSPTEQPESYNYGNQYLYEGESDSPTNELFFSEEILPDEIVYVKHECPICGLICDDMKALALHNNSHLTLRIQRYGERQLLMASLRRGNMVIVNGRRIVRCSNCLRTFANAEQIKHHWNTKMCMFYCKICSMSFHRNPEKIREHSLAAHGVILDKNRGMTVAPPLIWRPIKMDKRENDQIRPPALAPLERLVNNLVKREANNEQSENSNSNNNNNGQSQVSQNTPSGFTLKVKSVSSINASASNLNGNPGGSVVSDIPPLHFPQTAKKKTSMHPIFSSMLSKQVPSQRATCHICHCSFPNTNSRNSHMKVHKKPNESPSFSSSNRPTIPPPLAMSVPKMISQYTKVPQQQLAASVSTSSSGNPISQASNNYTVKVNLMTRPCGFRYYNRADFLKHRSECKDCRYACTQCSKNFQSGSELQMHYMLSHPKSIQYFKR